LQARFNPVAVRGELSGFSRAASGHCYFNLKDASGQIRCAMFRRAAESVSRRVMASWSKSGRLGVYEQRGDLQLVVESMRAGQGPCSSSFCASRPSWSPRACSTLRASDRCHPCRAALAWSLPWAAALHDVVTALRRRVPHIPVVIVPALVQGPQAPHVQALSKLYRLAQEEKRQAAICGDPHGSR
jgi:exodeoxyribonuclease VII large subunit